MQHTITDISVTMPNHEYLVYVDISRWKTVLFVATPVDKISIIWYENLYDGVREPVRWHVLFW